MAKVELTFTGLCLLDVTNDEGGEPQAMFILPDGRTAYEESFNTGGKYEESKGEDGESLRRHRAFCRFSAKYLGGPFTNLESDVVLYLNKQRVNLAGHKPQKISGVSSKLGNVWSLSRVIGATFSQAKSKKPMGVAAQILLDAGDFEEDAKASRPWTIDPRPNDATQLAIHPAHQIHVHMETSGRQLSLVISSFDDKPMGTVELAATDNEVISIEFANFCEDNPLSWPRPPLDSHDTDPDFKWYYTIADQKFLPNRPELENQLPIPKETTGGSKAGGPNCNPGTT